MPTVEEQVGTLVAEQATLVAEVIAERTARQASVTAAQTAEGGAVVARGGAETALTDTRLEAANAAQSASVATAAAAALVGTEGIIPTASEILWLASRSQAGVNALGFFDTGARLLSGVSERALLRYGEDNDTLNYMLLDGGVDGVRLDFTVAGAMFADASGFTPATPGSAAGLVLDQSEGLALGADQITNGGFDTDLTGWHVGANVSAIQDAGEAEVTFIGALTSTAGNWFSGGPIIPSGDLRFFDIEFDATWVSGPGSLQSGIGFVVQATIPPNSTKTRYRIKGASLRGHVAGSEAFSGFTFGITGTTTTVWRLDNVQVREVAGTHATQPNAALQGKFGKAPKVVRNLLPNSLFSGAAVGVVGSGGALPTGWTANAWDSVEILEIGLHEGNPAIRIRAERANNTGAAIFPNFQASGIPVAIGQSYVASLSAEVGAENSITSGPTLILQSSANVGQAPISGAWASYAATGSTAGTSANFNLATTVNNGTTGVLDVWLSAPQLEAGTVKTAFQGTKSSGFDVTESGVESFGFYRPDLSDDVLPLTVPAIDGDILIAGKKGTWIEPAAPSAGAFNIGPTTYTGGTPGILRAVGDITGVELIDKTLSAEERARVSAYYTGRGAKGLLTAGGTAILDVDFTTYADQAAAEAAGWIFGTGWALTGGRAVYTAGTAGKLIRALSVQIALTPHLVAHDLAVGSGGFVSLQGSDVGVIKAYASNVSGDFNAIYVPPDAGQFIEFSAGSGGGASVGRISIQELRPEEDW